MRTIPALNRPAPTPSTAALPTVPDPWPAREILDDPITAGVLYSAWSGDAVTCAPAPPGAGKTRLVALLAATLADRAGLRVGVAAQTRAQAAEVARRTGRLSNRVKLAWSPRAQEPDLTDTAAQLVSPRRVAFPPTGGGVLIATTARWLYLDHQSLACDVLVVDEAWQATYADICALGAFAAQIVCVGDPGQIAPVVTGSTRRWQDSPTAPHLPAPIGLMAAHGDAVSVVRLQHTWRLGPQTTALVSPAFYPSMPFTSRRPPEHITGPDGDPLAEVSVAAVPRVTGPGDPSLARHCADRARALLGNTLTTPEGTRPLGPEDLMVVTGHVSQAAAVQALLADHPGILVGTANAVQGMERPAVVALHPLAGYRTLDGFGLDPGRACVMLSRHRAHLTVVTDPGSGDLLDQPDPDAATGTHQRVWTALTHMGGA